ncbi:MAG: long-chain fatty acid--CoA ligase [Pseudomonadota bacterium]
MADWLENFVPRPVAEYLDDAVQRFPNVIAIDFLGKTMTYRDLGDQVNRVARGLQDLGVEKGTRIGLCLPNCPYAPIFYFAALKIGATVVNYNPLYVERELTFQAEDSETEIMVTLDLKIIYDKVEAVRRRGAINTIVVCSMADALPFPKNYLFSIFKRKEKAVFAVDDTHIPYSALLASTGAPDPVSIEPKNDVAVLQYTGGTTGRPKGAMLSHANVSANMEQMRTFFKSAELGKERILCVLPFFHVFAMTCAQNLSVLIGARMILLPRFELDQLLKTIDRTCPTIFPGVPTLYTAINNAPGIANRDLTCIKYCISGGAPLPMEVKDEFERKSGCRLREGYGLTEASPIVSSNPLDAEPRAGSIGQPMAGTVIEIRDLEDPEKIMPMGERGEVCVTGPQVMLGYWRQPEETDQVLKYGRLHTGDVGYVDEDGFIYLVDRIKDLIICSGYNVYPRVIEEAAYQHPDVEEAIAIAIPDAYRGQAPKLFVKLVEGGNATPEDLATHLEGHLSVIERPEEIEIRETLPKTTVGKLSKKELVAEETEKRASAAAE